MAQSVQLIADDGNPCGEGPLWDPALRRVLWVDGGSRVYQYDPVTGRKSVYIDDLSVSSMNPHRDGGMVIASGGIYRWFGPGHMVPVLTHRHEHKLNFNDSTTDARGRVLSGTAYWKSASMIKFGKLYIFDADGSYRIVDEGIAMSNGLAFSPDNRTLYYADSAMRKIYAYDYDLNSGTPSRRRTLVNVPEDEGLPDGMCVDVDGYIYSAQWFASQVVRYDPEGKVHSRITLPVTQVSSVTFGGAELTDLYITTASRATESPLAPPGYDFTRTDTGGGLYRVRVDTPGRAEYQAVVQPRADIAHAHH